MPDQFHTSDCKELVEEFLGKSVGDILVQKVPVVVYSTRDISLWACPTQPEKKDAQYVQTDTKPFQSFLRNLATAGTGIYNDFHEISYIFLEGEILRCFQWLDEISC